MRNITSLAVALTFAAAAVVSVAAQAPPSPTPAPRTPTTQTPPPTPGTTNPPRMPSLSATTSTDDHFVMDVAATNMAEIELGKVAADKASNSRVKDFANRMVNDHTKAGADLKSLADSKHITLAAMLDAQHTTLRDKLAGTSGAAFDRMYIDEMVKGHQAAVEKFRKESTSGADPDVKAWALKTLPTIEEHYKMAQDLQKEIGGAAKSSTSH